ncbi:unnamed protein product [Didymodactylos carnosus]|uniref:Protein HTATIP2 n=1 Tax=Didymodactylos carnosus TaxID=1234261 RepID=A0A814DXR7_9BILA|nr:unnamed protein product [Didymodactylos carnosus]CAF1583025.1 unnamed protein product [Didymodactylos carnosus]CAF3733456.1 unnamed protein product [Didymodactylos carnosus]CAF4383287.1 unnamed protein product [Didymodactylos carnosus]
MILISLQVLLLLFINILSADLSNMSNSPTALIVGYTGSVGRELVKELVKSNLFKKVILVGRRQVHYDDDEITNKTEQRQIDFEKIDDYAESFQGADVHFCALGTTRGKSGAEGFRHIDYDYVVNFGRIAKQNGCKHFHLVSSKGANANSFFLYTKTKGESEQALQQMAFERLSIYRPAMLMGERDESRPLEAVAVSIVKHTVQRVAPEWITTPTDILARAMCFNTFVSGKSGNEILENHEIFRLAETKPAAKPLHTNEL